VQEAFRNFVENVPFYGFAVMCIDHPVVQSLVGRIEDRRIGHLRRKSAGRRPAGRSDADGRRLEIQVIFRDRKTGATHEIADVMLRCRDGTTR